MADDKRFSPENVSQRLSKVLNAIDHPLFEKKHNVESAVQILPDKKISLGKFLAHPLIPGAFKAHPQTIAAVRKDIFMGGEGFEDLEEMVNCQGCDRSIDKQFWIFCPFCEAKFPK